MAHLACRRSQSFKALQIDGIVEQPRMAAQPAGHAALIELINQALADRRLQREDEWIKRVREYAPGRRPPGPFLVVYGARHPGDGPREPEGGRREIAKLMM
jgi:hypothetical protein